MKFYRNMQSVWKSNSWTSDSSCLDLRFKLEDIFALLFPPNIWDRPVTELKFSFHQKVTLHGASQHHSLQAKFDIYEGENVVFEGLAVNINFDWPPPVQLWNEITIKCDEKERFILKLKWWSMVKSCVKYLLQSDNGLEKPENEFFIFTISSRT